MIQQKKFFDSVRARIFNGAMTQKQVEGMLLILDAWEDSGYTDRRWLAYMLATTYHETAGTMQAIEEYGKGKGRPYGKKLKMGRGPGKRIPYTTPNHIYYGRGLVQLTWYENYEQMGRLLGIDLLNNPHLACDPAIAVKILFEGMTRGASSFGDFTGRCLEQYFNAKTEDWTGARYIINGKDKAKEIADLAKRFYAALS